MQGKLIGLPFTNSRYMEILPSTLRHIWCWRNLNTGKPCSKFSTTFFVRFLSYVGLLSKLGCILMSKRIGCYAVVPMSVIGSTLNWTVWLHDAMFCTHTNITGGVWVIQLPLHLLHSISNLQTRIWNTFSNMFSRCTAYLGIKRCHS